MNTKTLIIFLLVTAVIVFGVTRIPKFKDPYLQKNPEQSATAPLTSQLESNLQRHSLLRKGDGIGGQVATPRTESKKELQIKLKAKEQRQLAHLATVLDSDPDAAFYYEESERYSVRSQEITSSSEMSEIKAFLQSGSAEEQTERMEAYNEIMGLINIPEIVFISADPKLQDTIAVAFMNGVLPIPDDVTAWLQNVDEIVGYTEGINTGVFKDSLEWMIVNLQERKLLSERYVDGVLNDYGFPETAKETLHSQVRADMLSRIMSANLLHKDPQLLQLAGEIQSLRDRLAGF